MSFSHSNGRSRPGHLEIKLAVSVVVGMLVAVALFGAVGASANPSIQDQRARAQAIVDQVQQLDGEVGDASERFNGANYKLGLIKSELSATRADLVRARQRVRASQARVGARLRDIYVNGETAGALEVFLGAKSIDEIMDVLDATRRVTAQDSRIALELKVYRTQVSERESQLVRARAKQEEVVQQRSAEKASIEAKLAERKQLLSSVRAEVQRLVAEEQARQAELRRQAEVRLAEQQAAAVAARQRARLDAQDSAAAAAAPVIDPASLDGPSGTSDAVIPAPPPADASKGAQVVAIAMQYLGIPYMWGGASPRAGSTAPG